MGLDAYISSPFIIHQNEWNGTVSSKRLFHNQKPLNIEIGSGKGKTLLKLGKMFPDKNFLGLEKTPRCLKVFRDKVEKNPLPNIRIIHCFYETMLEESIPDKTIENFIVYFPDPWPKKKHRKRRFLRKNGLAILKKKLLPHGKIYMKTDFLDYWLEMLETAGNMKGLYVESFGLIRNWKSPFNVTSNYEQKYARLGKELYYLVVQKI